jgi:hypothetical protein
MSRNDKPRPNRRRSVQPTANAEPAPSTPSWRTRLIFERERLRQVYAKVATPLAHAGRLTVLIAVAAGAVAAGRLVEQHVRRAKAFETTTIELEGTQRLSRDQVLAAAGLALGKNVFEVSPEQAEERLRSHPFVAEASVTRRLPGSYRIVLQEQELAAVLQVGEQLLLVGQDATAVRLGKAPYAKKLRRLRGIFDKLERDDARPLYVYLDNERRPDRATVRLR